MKFDALNAFLYEACEAPYLFTADTSRRPACKVFPVHSKTGFAAARNWMLVHQTTAVAGVLVNGKVRYGARWMCGNGTADAVLVADPHAHGRLCRRCETAGKGRPLVYRCFGPDGRLLYIGSTKNKHIRFHSHEQQTSWWPEVANIQTEEFGDITAARSAEVVAIRTEHPAYNRMLSVRGVAR